MTRSAEHTLVHQEQLTALPDQRATDPLTALRGLADLSVATFADSCTVRYRLGEADGDGAQVEYTPSVEVYVPDGAQLRRTFTGAVPVDGGPFSGDVTWCWGVADPAETLTQTAGLALDATLSGIALRHSEHRLSVALARAEHLAVAVDSNRRIGAAIGIVMASRKLTEADAFQQLVESSQRTGMKLRDIAEMVLESGWLRSAGTGPARRRPRPD